MLFVAQRTKKKTKSPCVSGNWVGGEGSQPCSITLVSFKHPVFETLKCIQPSMMKRLFCPALCGVGQTFCPSWMLC